MWGHLRRPLQAKFFSPRNKEVSPLGNYREGGGRGLQREIIPFKAGRGASRDRSPSILGQGGLLLVEPFESAVGRQRNTNHPPHFLSDLIARFAAQFN